ncbi:MAG: PPOX class F420-dependent oxidoreductase [Actinomycetota bacterium]
MLSDAEKDLFRKANFAHLATVGPDGTPHSTPVWVDLEDGTILVNSARGRVKMRYIERDPRVAVSVHDQENPYTMVAVRGRVTDITEDGARDHIDAMAKKYLGQERYEWMAPGEVRVILKISPERVASQMV